MKSYLVCALLIGAQSIKLQDYHDDDLNDVPEAGSAQNDDNKLVEQLKVYAKEDTPELSAQNSNGVYSYDIQSIATPYYQMPEAVALENKEKETKKPAPPKQKENIQ